MATVIKAEDNGDARRVPTGVPAAADAALRRPGCELDDLASQAEEYLAEVRREAELVRSQAVADAADIRAAAHAEGIRSGEQHAQQRVESEITRHFESMLPALQAVVGQIKLARDGLLTDCEQSVIQLSVSIAERIIRRQLPHLPELPLEIVREALQLAGGSSAIRVRLHPNDLNSIQAHLGQMEAEISQVANATFAPDDRLTPGECLLETEYGHIDYRVASQLNRIERELLGAEESPSQ